MSACASFGAAAFKENVDDVLTYDDLASQSAVDYDICIIGAGPAGLTVARQFLGTSKRVLILESGDGPDVGFTDDLKKGEVEGGGSDGRLRYALPVGSGLEITRHRGFGGAMNLWTGRIRPLDPSDFSRSASPSGWPITFDQMRPWYNVALRDFGIDGLPDYDERPENSRRAFYPFNPRRHPDLTLKSWVTSYRDIISDFYNEIERSENVHCVLDATVVHVQFDGPEGDCPTGNVNNVTFKNSRNEELSIDSKFYVSACGGIENARLLLLSRKSSGTECSVPAHSEQGINNYWIGRCFMDHFLLPVGRIHYRDSGTFILNDPYSATEDGESNYYLHVGPSEEFVERTQIGNGAIAFGGANPEVSCSDPWRLSRIVAEYEQLPNPDSRITLSQTDVDGHGSPRARVEWRMSAEDKTSMLKLMQTFARAMHPFGGRVQLEEQFSPATPYLRWSGFGSHHMGTTRMAESPETGVVDRNLQVHGVDNLYVAGSSVFPTGGASNPTLTIMALSHRLAAHLRGRLQ